MQVDRLMALFHLQAASDRVGTDGLAAAMSIPLAEAGRLIDALVDDGLVSFLEAPDGTAPSAAATATGRALLLDEIHRVTGIADRVLGTFDAADRTTILRFLSRVAPLPRSG
ncbi:MAG: hypothetical protein ABWX82_01035 [Leifsonia sp.]